MDYEGRILTVDFGDYYYVNVYTPNAVSELKRLADRAASLGGSFGHRRKSRPG